MIIAVIGTTISPWMQFYIQAAVVDKGIREDDYALLAARRRHRRNLDRRHRVFHHRLVRGDDLRSQPPRRHIRSWSTTSSDVAVALHRLPESSRPCSSRLGLLNAAVFTASILPLSTAYYVCEAFGFERGVDHRFREAPIFYGFYLALITIGAGIVIVPGAPLLAIIFYSQVLNGVLLPIVLVLMLLLINNKRLMGAWTNRPAIQRHRVGDRRRSSALSPLISTAANHLPVPRKLKTIARYSASGARSTPMTSAVFVPGRIAVANVFAKAAAAGDLPMTTLVRFAFSSTKVGTFQPAPRNAPINGSIERSHSRSH